MRCLLDGRWREGILDPHRGPTEVRVQVLAWLPLLPLDDLSFQRPRSLRLVWNYTREIGIRATLVKIASRHEERFRNGAYLAAGLGRVLDAPEATGLSPGDLVEFVAPRHPPAAERAVVARELVRRATGDLVARLDEAKLLLLERGSPSTPLAPELQAIAGGSPHSGIVVGSETGRACLGRSHEELMAARWDAPRRLRLCPESAVAERHVSERRVRVAAKPAVLFGYGNYAKTAILPSLPSGIRLAAIHEIDPLQIPRVLDRRVRGGQRVTWDTAPAFRPGERYAVAFVAGFHHSHAPLAVEALNHGAVAVVEKPAATTETQLHHLLDAMRPPGRRLFLCFHKRYSPFNAIAKKDLGVERGEPISYHCIVYESPLPRRHWYRWPNSRSCIVSNGCHWLDHFLFLNDFAVTREVKLAAAQDDTVCCTVILENGALFSMTLTHEGSERLGVRDHVELRANGVTVTIENGARYRAEDRHRTIRTRRQSRLVAYRAMYQTIGRQILSGGPGDSARSVEASSRLTLALDQLLDARVANPGDVVDERYGVAVERRRGVARSALSRAR